MAWVRALIERTGSLEYAREISYALVGAALHEFDKYFDGMRDCRDLSFMRSLLVWVARRSH